MIGETEKIYQQKDLDLGNGTASKWILSKYKVLQKELCNFESLYKVI
jgi:hypothetical protein